MGSMDDKVDDRMGDRMVTYLTEDASETMGIQENGEMGSRGYEKS